MNYCKYLSDPPNLLFDFDPISGEGGFSPAVRVSIFFWLTPFFLIKYNYYRDFSFLTTKFANENINIQKF